MECDPSLDYHGNVSVHGWAPRCCLCLCVLLHSFHNEKQFEFQPLRVGAYFVLSFQVTQAHRDLLKKLVFFKVNSRVMDCFQFGFRLGPLWCCTTVIHKLQVVAPKKFHWGKTPFFQMLVACLWRSITFSNVVSNMIKLHVFFLP